MCQRLPLDVIKILTKFGDGPLLFNSKSVSEKIIMYGALTKKHANPEQGT